MPESDKREEPRVYGQADDGNRTSPAPAPEGMRGEGGPATSDHPELAHEETLSGGRRVLLEETNGVAFAEATGRAGIEAQHAHDARENKT